MRKQIFSTVAVIALLCSAVLSLQVQVRDGDLDTSFGEGGKVFTEPLLQFFMSRLRIP